MRAYFLNSLEDPLGTNIFHSITYNHQPQILSSSNLVWLEVLRGNNGLFSLTFMPLNSLSIYPETLLLPLLPGKLFLQVSASSWKLLRASNLCPLMLSCTSPIITFFTQNNDIQFASPYSSPEYIKSVRGGMVSVLVT